MKKYLMNNTFDRTTIDKYIFLSLLCVTNSLQSMNNNEHTPLLNSAIHGDLIEITLESIHDQLPQHHLPKQTSTEPSFIDQIILENNQTMCSPSIHDACHPKKLIAKTALTLCWAGLMYGGCNGMSALGFGCTKSIALIHDPTLQIGFASVSCGCMWCRNCIIRVMARDQDGDPDSHYNQQLRKQILTI